MHPLSTALFILGYSLALPIAFKMSTVVERQNRLGFFGHQTGILIALVGWLARGSVLVAVGHGLWLGVAYVWFRYVGPGRRAARNTVTSLRNRQTGR